jgi:hypothetical protein
MSSKVVGYRIGDAYRFEPWEEAGKEATPITIVMAEDVRVATSAKGQQLLYQDWIPYGQPLGTALALGWCWVEGEHAAAT